MLESLNFAIVPVKRLSHAKERLASLLSPAERRFLAFAMLKDVLSALTHSRELQQVVVVSSDPMVWEVARNSGAWIIEELSQETESASVEAATKICITWGASTVLIVPSDIPLITTEDVDFLVKKSQQGLSPDLQIKKEAPNPDSPFVIFVPSLDHKGTNAFLRRPPDIIPSSFGYDSLRIHITEAERQKIPYQIYELPRIALDIDSPEDLRLFLSIESPTYTYRELVKSEIPHRLRL
jgi:2-phospho-L-lactate guanylyltransferase